MCDVCRGWGNCPVGCDDVPTKECEKCSGEGIVYYNALDEVITKEEYDRTSEDERDGTLCCKCDGNGEVEMYAEDCYDPDEAYELMREREFA